jgi:hypothetical protein
MTFLSPSRQGVNKRHDRGASADYTPDYRYITYRESRNSGPPAALGLNARFEPLWALFGALFLALFWAPFRDFGARPAHSRTLHLAPA